MANRLAQESSPYLLQHKDNPVDWCAWGEEAFAQARQLDRPIFLSIGYAACHWCHVMAHESFEDPETAALLNASFVPVKVDREERPDVDSVYMEAVQRLTGQGGWPLSAFLLPDGRPFFGGTYFPPRPHQGMPSFRMVLTAVAEAYHGKRGDVEASAAELTASLGEDMPAPAGELRADIVRAAAVGLRAGFDQRRGGFGGAPKFPQPMALELLLRADLLGDDRALSMVEQTLDAMARGGLYDHLGGGFHRYTVDAQWLVPHFEKMLYDNAQLARAYTQAYQRTGSSVYREVALSVIRYVQKEMTGEEGGWFSSQDADSEGQEGAFFVWSAQEVASLLGAESDLFCRAYDVTPEGNFEGRNILHLPRPLPALAADMSIDPSILAERLAHGRKILFEARDHRVHPATDDKVITAWNGLMLQAFALAAAVFEDHTFRLSAERNAEFVLRHLRPEGRLLHTWRQGSAKIDAFLDDHAFLCAGLLALYETTGTPRWLLEAQSLADSMIERFADPVGGPFFSTSGDQTALIRRPRDLYDQAIPSGNSVAAEVLLRLATLTGVDRYRQQALQAMLPLHDSVLRSPLGHARLLCAMDLATAAPRELAIIGRPDARETKALLHEAYACFDPNLVVGVATAAEASAGSSPLFEGKVELGGRATAYLCRAYSCQAPVTNAQDLAAMLEHDKAT